MHIGISIGTMTIIGTSTGIPMGIGYGVHGYGWP
jgi:hypothetical protein